jgi:outer membrane lipoprotein-sorting protein
MKTKLISALSAALLIATGAAYAQDNMSGEQIAQKVHDTNKSAQGVVLKGKMTLAGVGGGASESRSMVLLAYDNGGQSNGVFRFTDSSYRGTTMLTIERKGQENLQYLYLPSVGSARQIEGSDREKNFVDTDFSNEDLGGSRISDYTYNRLPDRKAGTFDCYVIERFPKNRSSKYSKHVVTIDKATMIPIDVQFYAKSGRVVKSMRASNIKQISGNIRVPMNLQVVDIEKKHQTIINVSHAEEKNINRGYFNRNRLNMQWAEQ